jgi:hypothetical protein
MRCAGFVRHEMCATELVHEIARDRHVAFERLLGDLQQARVLACRDDDAGASGRFIGSADRHDVDSMAVGVEMTPEPAAFIGMRRVENRKGKPGDVPGQ